MTKEIERIIPNQHLKEISYEDNSGEVTIFHNDIEVFKYTRDYSTAFKSIFPLVRNGKLLVLVSIDYQYVSILDIETKKIIGEEPLEVDEDGDKEEGFCPVELYIPYYRNIQYISTYKNEDKKWSHLCMVVDETCLDENIDKYIKDRVGGERSEYKISDVMYGDMAFVSGCYWGDDGSWKVQGIKVSEVDKGIIERKEYFGYIELAGNLSLKESIEVDNCYDHPKQYEITHKTTYRYKDKEDEFTDFSKE